MSYRASLLRLCGLITLITGCAVDRPLTASLDDRAFSWFGRTFFSNPEVLSLKEIHLGSGALTGKEVIIEGKVAVLSEHGTYLVLVDEAARMLVVLTGLDDSRDGVAAGVDRSMRVFGTIESGKKGLPYLKAHALSLKVPNLAGSADGKA